MNEEILIRCSEFNLALDEKDLIKGLRPDLLEKAIAQGKSYIKAERFDFIGDRSNPWNRCKND